MQGEINGAGWPVPVRILGINAVGEESANAQATAGRSLPWLQETADQPVWATWDVTWRDVVILRGDNTVYAVYNLTDQSLADAARYAELKALLQAAAGAN